MALEHDFAYKQREDMDLPKACFIIRPSLWKRVWRWLRGKPTLIRIPILKTLNAPGPRPPVPDEKVRVFSMYDGKTGVLQAEWAVFPDGSPIPGTIRNYDGVVF